MQIPPYRPEPDLNSIKNAIDLLIKAKRPVIVAGGGANTSGARKELIKIAEKLNVPVATSLNAKEVFPYDHPLAVGVPGSYSRSCANKIVAESDLVFFIGSHTGSQITNNWRIPRKETKIIQLDINPAELGRSFPVEVGLMGDVKASLNKMLNNIAQEKEIHTDWILRIKHLVNEWKAEVSPLLNSDAIPMRPERLSLSLIHI